MLGTLVVVLISFHVPIHADQNHPQQRAGPWTIATKLNEVISAIHWYYPKYTLVFVPISSGRHCEDINYLWRMPRSHIFLSTEDFILKANDREVILACERKSDAALSDAKRFFTHCAHKQCSESLAFSNSKLEKRIIIHVMNFPKNGTLFLDNSAALQSYIWNLINNENVSSAFFLHHLTSVVLVRARDREVCSLSVVIFRSYLTLGGTMHTFYLAESTGAMMQYAFYIEPIDQRKKFNRTFYLDYISIYFPRGDFFDFIHISECNIVSSIRNHTFMMSLSIFISNRFEFF